MQLKHTLAFSLLAVAGLSACDDSTGPEGPIDVTVDFAALVNGADFACGQSYTNVGTMNTEITPTDFRFYVSDVQLIKSDGSADALELEQDGLWQRENVALLDFESGSLSCVNGTTATNTSIRGTVPGGDYTGLRFTLGIPAGLNHQDVAAAPPPFDLSGLYWNWNGGYKFARIDHNSAAPSGGWNFHLGSTGCTPSGDPTVPATACTNAHRPTVTFDVFDWEVNEVVADYGVLLEDSNLMQNTNQLGCMSFPGDPDCPEVMNNLGLDYEGSVSGGQKFFSVR